MGIPILAARDVEDGDTAERAWVAVVSELFAKKYWPGQDPIGQTFLYADRLRTVVGVVGDVKVRGLERTNEPQIYLSAVQVAGGMFSAYDPKELVIGHIHRERTAHRRFRARRRTGVEPRASAPTIQH